MRLFTSLLPILIIGCGNDQEIVVQEVVYTPSMSVLSPADGAWIEAGSADLTADLTDIAMVHINGTEHAIDSGSFSAPLELAWGINHFETEATGIDGSVIVDRRTLLAGDFVAADGAVASATTVRVNQGGLNTVASVAEGMIDSTSLNADLETMNPVVDLDYSLGTGAAVSLSSIYFEAPTIDVAATDGALALTVMLPNLYIDTDVTTSLLWIETEHDLEMAADWAVIEAELILALVDGIIEAELVDPAVSLTGFAYDVSVFPGEFIEDNLLDDTIREGIEDALVEEMSATLPEVLAGLQEDFDLSMNTEILDTELIVSSTLAALSIDADGVQLDMDVDVEIAEQLLGGGTLTSNAAPPQVDRTVDAAIVLADDLLNRALYELWAGGVLNQTFSTVDGSLDPESLSTYGITTATVTTNATLPPVLVETNDQLQLQLGGMEIAANTPGFGMGENITLSVTATADVGLTFADGHLAPTADELVMHLDIVETDWTQEPEFIIELVSGLITPERMLGVLDGVSIELPALSGVRFDDAEISHSGYHSDLRVEMVAE